ncbi:PREDICTED: leucine-rich repeat and guanylate kinase domain-containing protein-like, partial [Galeopterus variegatus]|uniref:Leucine-rich repeat and guanylate kinase domain-containing protein-like n=1 Tax=Galeopterus variegatus TaxID=482537 RepID=A0ABM0SG11_GALVR
DLDVAYEKLSQLIREYLGLTEEPAKSLAPTADVKTPHRMSEEPPRKLTTSNIGDSLVSMDRNYFVKLWAKLSAKKTPAERESMHKQHETARQALMGKIPPDHTLLFQRGPVPAPIINDLNYFTAFEELQKNFELCEDYFKPPFGPYPEKSDKESYISMKYSAFFQSCPWARELPFQPPEGSVSSRPGSGVSDGETDQALKELHVQSFSHEKRPLQHGRHTISIISRPGSNTKPTLPPIPQGRK